MEQIYNYLDMSAEQRTSALNALRYVGFSPACGDAKTMQKIMDKSIPGEMPQFYFAFRDEKLIGYMFLIGNAKRFRAFPWWAVDNLDELPMRIAEPMIEIAIEVCNNTGNSSLAEMYRSHLEDFKQGIGKRKESDCR